MEDTGTLGTGNNILYWTHPYRKEPNSSMTVYSVLQDVTALDFDLYAWTQIIEFEQTQISLIQDWKMNTRFKIKEIS